MARLRAAGAAIIGTLNMEEAALGAKTDNIFFGATQNPHHIGYTPGGSSGGSAAAVAAGLCDVALGTDTMGSVRIPAAYCGIYGLKPTRGAISQDGLEIAEATLDSIGPMARSLEDLEACSRILLDIKARKSLIILHCWKILVVLTVNRPCWKILQGRAIFSARQTSSHCLIRSLVSAMPGSY
ncbi:amidase family protein [Sphingopyxis sp. BSNA05]|uniref:amidase family protein n=1 Tax=Sphingopyxis sp. BSNA05 TaxID=1236614 RepID=UPI00349F8EA8